MTLRVTPGYFTSDNQFRQFGAPVAEGIALPSLARTAAVPKTDIVNPGGGALIVVIDATAFAATPSVVVSIWGKDPASGKYWLILASAAITGVSTTILRVSPDLTGSANLIAKDIVPATIAIDVAVGDADSLTYSVGYAFGL